MYLRWRKIGRFSNLEIESIQLTDGLDIKSRAGDDETLHPGFYEYLVEIYKNCEGNGQWDKARWSSGI